MCFPLPPSSCDRIRPLISNSAGEEMDRRIASMFTQISRSYRLHKEDFLVQWVLETKLARHVFNHIQTKEMEFIINKSSDNHFIKRNLKIKTKTGISVTNQRIHHLYES